MRVIPERIVRCLELPTAEFCENVQEIVVYAIFRERERESAGNSFCLKFITKTERMVEEANLTSGSFSCFPYEGGPPSYCLFSSVSDH
jgi:hypothetical protein